MYLSKADFSFQLTTLYFCQNTSTKYKLFYIDIDLSNRLIIEKYLTLFNFI